MALKPLPRLILIAVVICGAAFAYVKFAGSPAANNVTASSPVVVSTSAQIVNANMPANLASGNVLDNIVASGTINVGVQNDSKPFFVANGGVASGFNVEFLNLLLGHELPSVQRKVYSGVDTYEDVPKQLLGGKIDIAIDGLTFPDQTPAGVVYTIPYIEDFGYSLIAGPTANLRPDLSGAQIGILKGDPDVKAAAQAAYPKAQLIELSDASTNGQRTWIRDAIEAGKVDAIIYDYPFGVAEIANTNLQFVVTKVPGASLAYKIGVRAGDKPLLDKLNLAIRKIKATPEYGDLIRKHFMSSNVKAASAAKGGETSYVVKRGDTLSLIAEQLLGSRMRYVDIESRNNLPNPSLISVGQKLVIPKH